MKRLLKLLAVSTLFTSAGALAAVTGCFHDGLPTQLTGRTQWQHKELHAEARCPKGHSRWIRLRGPSDARAGSGAFGYWR